MANLIGSIEAAPTEDAVAEKLARKTFLALMGAVGMGIAAPPAAHAQQSDLEKGAELAAKVISQEEELPAERDAKIARQKEEQAALPTEGEVTDLVMAEITKLTKGALDRNVPLECQQVRPTGKESEWRAEFQLYDQTIMVWGHGTEITYLDFGSHALEYFYPRPAQVSAIPTPAEATRLVLDDVRVGPPHAKMPIEVPLKCTKVWPTGKMISGSPAWKAEFQVRGHPFIMRGAGDQLIDLTGPGLKYLVR
jgi:hypothetical protein